DDDDGRAARRIAARTRDGHRFRTAAAVGNFDYRRTACESDVDVVYHAGGLSLSGSASVMDEEQATDYTENADRKCVINFKFWAFHSWVSCCSRLVTRRRST